MKKNLIISIFLLLSVVAFGPRLWAFPAAPSVVVTSFEVNNIGGTDYFDVEATMVGTLFAHPVPYNVPVKFLYPVDPGVCNGTGIVDLLNNSAMILLSTEGLNPPQAPLPAARARLTDEFLGREHYTYIEAQWERTRGGLNVINLFNQLFQTNYVIPTDGHQFAIILDAATALKSPPAGLPGSPCAASTIVGYGMSASTVPLNLLKQPALVGPAFAAAFADLYDGLLWDSITFGFLPFPVSKTGVPTIEVSAETDVQLFRNDFLRGDNATYRHYEIAGVTHVSIDEHNLDDILPGLPFVPDPVVRQNPQTHSPVFRAMMEHLRIWVTVGTPPPPGVNLDGSNYAFLPLMCQGLPIPGIADIPRDSDGNALGGIRLPHMRTQVDPACVGDSCQTRGSPLGVYDGINTQHPCKAGGFEQVVIVMGTYTPDEAILDRYTNKGKFVSGISNAADFAFEQGWILEEDIENYTSTAAHCVVGHVDTEDITLDDLKDCHEI